MAPKGEKSFAKKNENLSGFLMSQKNELCRIRGIGRNGAIFTQQWHFSLPSSFLSISTCPFPSLSRWPPFCFVFLKKKKFDKIHFLLLFPPPFGM
jgi:hypothetical protein